MTAPASIPTAFGAALPETWDQATVGELFDVQQGKALSPSARRGAAPRPFLRTANVLWSRLDLETVDHMDFDDSEARRLRLEDGDLLVCEGGEIGRTAIWREELPGCLYQNHIHRLRRKSPEIVPEFVMFWLRAAFQMLGCFEGVGNKTTIPNLSGARLKELFVPAPERAEQRAIAQVLAAAQQAVDVESSRIAVLKELKAATMAKVFREGLRGEPRKLSDIGEVPSSWGVVPLGSIQTKMNYGTSVHCTLLPAGSPVLRIPNVIGGGIDESELKYAALTQGEVEKLLLEAGDLLFVRTNGNRDYTGRCAVYVGSPPDALFASYLIRVRLQPDTILPVFAQHFLGSVGRSQITSRANSAADGKFNIDTGILRGLLLPKPPLEEQREILQTVAAVEAKVASAKQRLIRLRELFTGCLYELMTGQFRVTPLLEKEVADAG